MKLILALFILIVGLTVYISFGNKSKLDMHEEFDEDLISDEVVKQKVLSDFELLDRKIKNVDEKKSAPTSLTEHVDSIPFDDDSFELSDEVHDAIIMSDNQTNEIYENFDEIHAKASADVDMLERLDIDSFECDTMESCLEAIDNLFNDLSLAINTPNLILVPGFEELKMKQMEIQDRLRALVRKKFEQ